MGSVRLAGFRHVFPIFAAAPQAQIFGAALPQESLRDMMQGDFSAVFSAAIVAKFQLDQPLPEEEQRLRNLLQARSHCDALPETMLPGMVSVQRARDAALAAAAQNAFGKRVFTCSCHHWERACAARLGAPAALNLVDAEVVVFALGQSENGIAPNGTFDKVIDAPALERDDPCLVFQKTRLICCDLRAGRGAVHCL